MAVKIIQLPNPGAMRGGKIPSHRINWPAVKEDYFAQNLVVDIERPFSLHALAAKWKIGYGSVRNRAGKEDWAGQLHDLIARRSSEAVDRLRQEATFDEMEIRQRHARVARVAMAKALSRLQSIEVTKLTTRDAIDLLRLSMEQERKAAGIDTDKSQLPPPAVHEGFESPQEKIARIQKSKGLADKLMAFLEHQGVQSNAVH